MVDAHCHLDQYSDPAAVAQQAHARGVTIIAVTALPSHFAAGESHVRGLYNVRLALGLHPLLVEQHDGQLELFERLLPRTSYVGEVGLDGSKHGKASYRAQLTSFRFVLARLSATPKVVSIHSRGAEEEVLALLEEYRIAPAILHWYSGSIRVAERAVSGGHFFSVNPAMIASGKGRQLLERIPPGQILTETDGPYVSVGSRRALPWDVFGVVSTLEEIWGVDGPTARTQLRKNIQSVCAGRAPS